MCRTRYFCKSAPQRARGVALVVVLLFLVALSAVGIWMARQSVLAENMARNQMDHEVARQAAESALRDAERDIDTAALGQKPENAPCQRNTEPADTVGLNPAEFTDYCLRGLCYMSDADHAKSNWAKANRNNQSESHAQPWWPSGKGGRWNDRHDTKPGRVDPATGSIAINSSNCDGFAGGVPLGTYTGADPIPGVAKQPEYLIEIFRRKRVRNNQPDQKVLDSAENSHQWSTMYRVTARGFGYSKSTQVVLQTVFFP